MTPATIDIFGVLISVIGTLLVMLTAVIGWIGSRLHERLDSIAKSLSAIEKDLRGDLSELDRRLIAVEIRHRLEETGKYPGTNKDAQ